MHTTNKKGSWFQRLEQLHPYETLLYLGMVGSGLIFLFMAVAFLFSGSDQLAGSTNHMPISFLVSTFLLIGSGYTSNQIRLYYLEEQAKKLIAALRNTLMLGISFTGLQLTAWFELEEMGISLDGLPAGSFLYLLSGIHLFHLVGAMIFATILWVQLKQNETDEVRKLIWLTNPYEKMRIRLFTIYWHFMELIWLILFLLFVISF